MANNRIKVDSKDKQGKKTSVYVTRPTKEENSKSQIVANKVFKDALMNGALVRKVLEKWLEDQGIWNQDKQKEVDDIDDEIRENLIKLKKGGIKLSEAKQVAIDIRMARVRKNQLMMERNSYDEYTAEALSDNAKFDYLASVCIKDKNGEPYFESVEDYQQNGDQPFAIEAAGKLAAMVYGLDDDWESNLPENQFLSKYKFVNDDLRLVDKDGRYVTTDGKLIDSNFRYIDEQNNYVDYEGNRVDEDGLPIVESSPFLDDDGKPVE